MRRLKDDGMIPNFNYWAMSTWLIKKGTECYYAGPTGQFGNYQVDSASLNPLMLYCDAMYGKLRWMLKVS